MFDTLLTIAKMAGQAILAIPRDPNTIQNKDDGSPLSKADLASHNLILGELAKSYPQIPIISEEGFVGECNALEPFFLIDPLDGTKEYISGSGEYTVNIALIKNGRPLYAVVGAPALGLWYWYDGDSNSSWTSNDQYGPVRIQVDKHKHGVLMVSRSHRSDLETQFAELANFAKFKESGSSLKGCMVARGEADCYFRAGRVMAWDIAAMDGILTGAGAQLLTLATGNEFKYSPTALAVEGGFIAASKHEVERLVALWQNR